MSKHALILYRQLSVGPEPVFAMLTGALVGLEDDLEERIALAGVLTFLVGAFTLLFGYTISVQYFDWYSVLHAAM